MRRMLKDQAANNPDCCTRPVWLMDNMLRGGGCCRGDGTCRCRRTEVVQTATHIFPNWTVRVVPITCANNSSGVESKARHTSLDRGELFIVKLPGLTISEEVDAGHKFKYQDPWWSVITCMSIYSNQALGIWTVYTILRWVL